MTPAAPIPDDLLHFIDNNVESVEQLEVLRVLGEKPDKRWPAVELATETQISPAVLAAHVTGLERRGLLKTSTDEGQLTCVYSPRTPELGALLGRLLQFYRERPVTLIQTVYARADQRLKAFADAFRLRKES